MIYKIIILSIFSLIIFYSGVFYAKSTNNNSEYLRESYFTDVSTSMDLLIFMKEKPELAEKIFLSKISGFFKSPVYIPANDKEKIKFDLLFKKALNFQKTYCNSDCLLESK